MKITGKALVYGDSINTDEIIPGKYLNCPNPEDLAPYAMTGIDPDFPTKCSSGDIIVAGEHFGCGSSREQAVLALKYAQVGAIIAKSFARIFFRNAINQGLQIIQSPDVIADCSPGDTLIIELTESVIKNTTAQKHYPLPPYPPLINDIVHAGGLLPFLKSKKD